MRLHNLLTYIPLGCFICIVLLALFTWTASVYGMDVVNLLSADGIRWMFANVMNNIALPPLAMILLCLMALSAVEGSGLLDAIRGRTNAKQKNALVITLVVLIIFAVAIACMTFLPSALLLNPLGTLSQSPFTRGLPAVTFIVIIICADIYGYTSGRLLTIADVVKADTQLIADIASYFLSFIIIAQMVACFDYSEVFQLCPDGDTWFLVFKHVVYLLPLLLHLIHHYVGTRRVASAT